MSTYFNCLIITILPALLSGQVVMIYIQSLFIGSFAFLFLRKAYGIKQLQHIQAKNNTCLSNALFPINSNQ